MLSAHATAFPASSAISKRAAFGCGLQRAGHHGAAAALRQSAHTRKILVVDGATAFVGGTMNIRAGFVGSDSARDTNFRVTGLWWPTSWRLLPKTGTSSTGEVLLGPEWACGSTMRCLGQGPRSGLWSQGPDTHIETNHRLLLGAFSVAETVDPDCLTLLPAGYDPSSLR